MTEIINFPPERQLPPGFRKDQPPLDAVAELLKRQNAVMSEYEKRIAAEHRNTEKLAEHFALELYKKRKSEQAKAFKTFWTLLADEGIELITHEGEELTEAIEKDADIVEWLPTDGNPIERVAEAVEPEIHFQGRMIHRAKLSCIAAEMASESVAGQQPAPGQEPEPAQQQPEPMRQEPEPAQQESEPSQQQPESTQQQPESTQQQPEPAQLETKPTQQPEPMPRKPLADRFRMARTATAAAIRKFFQQIKKYDHGGKKS